MSGGSSGGEKPATRADLVELGREIREGFHGLLDGLRGAMNASGTVQQVTVPQPFVQPQRTERLVWVMCVATAVMAMVAGGLAMAVVLQGQRISDLRADMHAERASREAFDNWNAQEVTAIRSYINTGRLQPMQPRPQPEPAP